MGQIIPFSKIETYLESINKLDIHKGAILDTNILISASYEVRDSHWEVIDILEILEQNDYRLFATVNTRSEFLEFHRRLILTENLFDIVDEYSKLKISKDAKAKIQSLKGSLKSSMTSDSTKDEVFNESQLKKSKRNFQLVHIPDKKVG